ncbi:hypothetical protein DFS34DRAFT_631461 [Phlyctochytrium arcticum]|nr:hypothetical protein DFS34DRAFT_631444 [Phlyctochytrium arcticum]KAI9093059.1 hypothetical protein DFS34DRAFT_631461 [Phlyctochytrium arcticum]
MPVFTEAFRVDQKQVPRSIDQYDKYGFLTRCESPDIREGVTYQFKSDAVRKCIYYMMVLTQRQQLHLNIALHYENRITKDKDMRPALLISLFEHYMQTDDRQVMKRIKYMEEVAGFYWEKRLVTESIKHYRWLISTVQENEIKRDQTFYTADTRSDWHRHLAEAYMWKDDVVNAEINALQSLKCLGCPMPTGATRLEFEIRKSRRNEKAWRKEWVPWEKKRKDAEEMDPVHRSNLEAARDIYQKSAKSLRETSQIELAGSFSERADIADQPRLPLSNDFQSEMRAYLSSVPEQLHANLFSASPRQYDSSDSDLVDLIARDPRMARQHKVRLTLLILAEINLRLDRRRELMWCITTGLNLCYNFPLKIIFGRFLALWALYLSRYETKKKFKESPEYARAAASKERSGDIFSSIHLHETIASFYFDNSKVLGNAEHALDHYEKALSAAKLAGDKVSISRIWRLKSLLLFWTVKRIDSQKEAQAYLTWAFDEENDEGKFYASAILSANLLEGDRPNEEIEECSSKMSQAVNRAVVGKGDHIAKILYDALNMKTNFKLGRTVDPAFLAEAGNAAILERTSNAHQPMANLAYFVFYDVNRLIWRLGWHDQQSLGDNLAILSFMSRRLKKIMKWQYPAEPVYYAIASLKAEIRGQVKKAHESFCKSYRHTASLSYFDGKLNFHHFEFLDKVASTKQLRNYNEYVLSSKALADTVMKQMGMAADSPDQYMEGAW